MMARITLMTAYINCFFNKNGKVGIDLDKTIVISFIPVITIPGFIVYKLKLKAFLFR